ncbi:stalk domain-containing protein [Paenibacillus sp. CF384]|uniref:stalk domain-containing protein n=1 Tax=Paenibacillus sp. CF384 TaxID=1884382 RepID=UPI000897B35A|nr:stalk domain-containing protein [Paenibacillus sp. CF384]SDX29416.1 Copper amine oxidase N-terminal domain-containing protein [Paenibacillus sp. CF384]
MMKKWLAILITACMVFALMPMTAGAAADKLVIKLAIGSPTLSVNGSTSTIQKPFKLNGTTMVPLSVITKAFGAGLKLENNKIITLSYNATKVVLTIGSTIVKVNGAPITLTAEPKIVNGVTMVPLRVIVSAFGATLSLSGNQITINGVKANGSAAGSNTGGINSDAGKTKVGDSYYGWTMNYPSDLALSYQSDNGSATQWASAQEDRRVSVFVEDVDQAYTREELRDYIIGYFSEGEFAVEKKTITLGTLSFERMISKDRDGWFYDNRVIQVGTRIYFIAVGIKSDSREKLNAYQSVMDSFKPSFAKSDASIKDVTKVKDNRITISDADFGFTVKLPVDWARVKEESMPAFTSDDGYLTFAVSSLQAGDTAGEWLKRSRKQLEETTLPDYVRNISESTVILPDGKAEVLSYEYTYDKKDWNKEYQVFFISGTHKYEIDFFYFNEPVKGDALFAQIAAFADIDTAFIEKNFTDLGDDTGLAGMTVTKKSNTYGYSIALPQSWTATKKNFEEDTVEYALPEGSFVINVWEDREASEYNETLKKYITTDPEMVKSGARITSSGPSTIGNGIPVTKVEWEMNDLDVPVKLVYYVVEMHGGVYLISYALNQANLTESNLSQIEKAVHSFAFTN